MPRLISKTVVPRKNKKGKVAWYARIVWEGHDGRPRTKEQKGQSKTHARALRDRLAADFDAGGEAVVSADRITFEDLADSYIKDKCIPAVYVGERKVAGQKHPDKLRNQVERLKRYFGQRRIRELQRDYEAVDAFKLHLIQAPTQHGKQRSMHDTNNQLRTLRMVMNYARRKGWIQTTPFEIGEPLINPSDELPRAREERPGEIERLLDHCTGRRAHLRPWIVTAHQTAARPGEVSRIERRDLFFDEKLIRLRASTTKTNRERFVPMTDLVAAELRAWLDHVAADPVWSQRVPDEPTAKIFGDYESNKTAFKAACEDAGITDLQRKDLRKFSTTTLVAALLAAGISEKHGMAITGHTQVSTFQSYIVTGKAIVQQAGAALERWNQREGSKEPGGKGE